MAEQNRKWHDDQVNWLEDLVEVDKRRDRNHRAEWTKKALKHSKKQLRQAKAARRRFIRQSKRKR